MFIQAANDELLKAPSVGTSQASAGRVVTVSVRSSAAYACRIAHALPCKETYVAESQSAEGLSDTAGYLSQASRGQGPGV